jgi:hypothetical protein
MLGESEVDSLSLYNEDNYGISSICSEFSRRVNERPSAEYKVVVWGGCVANCAEDSLSEAVYDIRDRIISFLYFPSRTKGGVVMRPLYFKGNRNGSCVYPNLRNLTLPLLRYSSLSFSVKSFGYEVPSLEHLAFITSDSRIESISPEWTDLSIPERILIEHPRIKSIQIVFGLFSKPMVMNPIISFYPPQMLGWEVCRVLFLGIRQQHDNSPFAKLSSDLLRMIIGMINHSWIVKVYPSPPMSIENESIL